MNTPLLDYAMAIAHERELEVTGHKHDTEGAVRRFNAAIEADRQHIIEQFLNESGQYVTNAASREAAIKQAIEADRKQRHLKEEAQLEREWAQLRAMQAQVEADRQSRGEPVDWQPIETAPKDGTTILVWFKQHGAMTVCWGDRDYDHTSEYAIWLVDDHKHGPYPVRGYSRGDDTHWMSLPSAPQPAEPVVVDHGETRMDVDVPAKYGSVSGKVVDHGSEPVKGPSDEELLDFYRSHAGYEVKHSDVRALHIMRSLLDNYQGAQPVANAEPAFYISPKVIEPSTGKISGYVRDALTWDSKPSRLWSVPVYLAPVSASAEPVIEIDEDKNGDLAMFAPGFNVVIARFARGGDSGFEAGTKLYAAPVAAQPSVPAYPSDEWVRTFFGEPDGSGFYSFRGDFGNVADAYRRAATNAAPPAHQPDGTRPPEIQAAWHSGWDAAQEAWKAKSLPVTPQEDEAWEELEKRQ